MSKIKKLNEKIKGQNRAVNDYIIRFTAFMEELNSIKLASRNYK